MRFVQRLIFSGNVRDRKTIRIGITIKTAIPKYIAWGISILLIVVGFIFLRRAMKTINRSWQEVTQIIKKGAD